MLHFLASIQPADWVKIFIYLVPVLSIGLTLLAKQKVVARNAALSGMVTYIQQVLQQTKTELESPPVGGWNKDNLFTAGVAEVKSMFDNEIKHIGWASGAVDTELQLMFQREASKLPEWAQAFGSDFFGSTGAATVSGAYAKVAARRMPALSFARAVGPVRK